MAESVGDSAKAPQAGVNLPYFPVDFTVHYLTTEDAVDSALEWIVDGVLGFDTEFVRREFPPDERFVGDMVAECIGNSNRKGAILGLQIMERKMGTVPYIWNEMGLCTIQLARDATVWVINLRGLKAYPQELERVLTSDTIMKVGVGLVSDIPVIWNDLRSELASLVDCGLMTRLLLAEKYASGGFQNLSMDVCAAEVLRCRVDKSLQVSDWTVELSDAQIRYAATDAMVAWRLYDALVGLLEGKCRELDRDIPIGWYAFDSRMGEPVRLKRTIRGDRVPWSTKDCPWFFKDRFQGYYP
ncbi:ribonuclease H-like domain-containing protein [Mycena crocata]|nr:ribonuclease H-like domain-containing protein [Mycena crocata]